MEIKKIDEHTIEVTKQEPAPAPKVIRYDYDFLLEQRKNIQAQKDRENALRDAELKEVDELIAEADKLGVKAVDANPE